MNEVWITPFLDTDSAQHFHRVGHHLDARADTRKTPRLLVHAHIGADLAQRGAASFHPMPAPTMAMDNLLADTNISSVPR